MRHLRFPHWRREPGERQVKRLMALQPAFRWPMLGFVFSNLDNADFEGGWAPGALIVGLPTWVAAFRPMPDTVRDFMFPPAGMWSNASAPLRPLHAPKGRKASSAREQHCCPTAWAYGNGCARASMLAAGDRQTLDAEGMCMLRSRGHGRAVHVRRRFAPSDHAQCRAAAHRLTMCGLSCSWRLWHV